MRALSPCLLTTRDFAILQSQLERNDLFGDPILPMIRNKLSSAQVVFAEDVDSRIVTLNSRVVFRVNGGAPVTRVVVHARENTLVGVTIPILIPRGLALLGMAEGEHVCLGGPDQPDRIDVVKVAFQPEAVRRALGEEEFAVQRPATGRTDPPALRRSAQASDVIDLAARRVVSNRAKLRNGPAGNGSGPSVA